MILNLTSMELDFLHLLRNISNSFLDFLFEAITFLGEQYAIIVVLVIVYYGINKKIGQRMLYSICCAMNFNNILKLIVKRPRPFSSVHQNPVTPARGETASGFSFPSGHTQNAASTFTSLAILFKKNWLTITSIILIVLIGFSRLWLGCHYPTDVIVGLVIGVGFAILLTKLHEKVEANKNHKYLMYIISLLLFLPFVIINYIQYKQNNLEYFLYKDLFVCYALACGAFVGVWLEEKYVNFSDAKDTKTKVLRSVFGFIFTIATYLLLSLIFKAIAKDCIELDFIRYFMVSFVAIGIYPICLKKWLFK